MRQVYAALLSNGQVQMIHSTREELLEHVFEYADAVHAALGVKLVCLIPCGTLEDHQT